MSEEKEYTGGSVSYYAVDVNAPINVASDPYTAECQDIIEALKLDFNEGNVLKAIWRRAAARLGRSKKGYDDGLYDAEKIVFYGQRLVAIEQRAKPKKVAIEIRCGECNEPWPEDSSHRCETIDPKKWPARKYDVDLAPTLKKPETDPYGLRDVEGWYSWNGDAALRPAGKVEVELRDGSVPSLRGADCFDWTHGPDAADIVKWRPAQ